MILIFILLWFSALWGMEQEIEAPEASFRVLSLQELAMRSVHSHIANKKIPIDCVRCLSSDLIMPILSYSLVMSSVFSYETSNSIPSKLSDLLITTSDHRHLLVNSRQGRLRVELDTKHCIVVDEFVHEDLLDKALSPSGNLLAFLSYNTLWVKDIAHDKVIEKDMFDYLRNNELDNEVHLYFLGEKNLLIFNQKYIDCLSIDKKLESRGYLKNRCVGMLPAAQEYISYTNGFLSIANDPVGVLAQGGIFSRITADGKVKNTTAVKNLFSISRLEPAIYEPGMLIAYEQEHVGGSMGCGWIDVVSLKGWPNSVTPLTRVPCRTIIGKVVFANKGQWLMIVASPYLVLWNELTIWDLQGKQRLYKYKFEDPLSDISYTDYLTPHTCLFKLSDMDGQLYSFDPIKLVAANMLSQKTSQQTIATSNNNNSNNNNDNELLPTISMEIDK